jgi:hypothetical protein
MPIGHENRYVVLDTDANSICIIAAVCPGDGERFTMDKTPIAVQAPNVDRTATLTSRAPKSRATAHYVDLRISEIIWQIQNSVFGRVSSVQLFQHFWVLGISVVLFCTFS